MTQRWRRGSARLSWVLASALAAASGARADAPVPHALDAEARAAGRVRVIARLSTGATQADRARRQRAALADLGPGAAPARRYAHIDAIALEATPADLRALAANAEVLEILADGPLAAPSLDITRTIVGANAATSAGFTGANTAVAVLDTGVDAQHAFFGGRVTIEACFSAGGNCPNGQTAQFGSGAGAPCAWSGGCGHGTHVAGIVASSDPVYRGVAPEAEIFAIQIFSRFTGASCAGTGYDPCALAYPSDILAGLDYARSLANSLPLAAVNMSFGSGAYATQTACDNANGVVRQAVEALRGARVASVAASGNAASANTMTSPACLSNAVGVGATDDADRVEGYSNAAPMLDFLAPGAVVVSAAPGGTVLTLSGTSMASPHVAGAYAVLRQAMPAADLGTLRSALSGTGRPVVDTRPGANGLSRPRVQVDIAVKSLAPTACFDSLDNDADGFIDYPLDPSCVFGTNTTEAPLLSSRLSRIRGW